MRFPTLVGDAMPGATFPFRSWAAHNHFTYPIDAADFLAQCGSAAEAFFARVFVSRPGVVYSPRAVAGQVLASQGGFILELQVRCANYLIDAMVSTAEMNLAIEIDGMAFHNRTRDQVAADYLRERRIVLKGNTVIRFTAQEVFLNADECWRQVEAIFARRRHA